MVNYQEGKIYRIVCNSTGMVYIGSTTCPKLSQRLAEHGYDYKKFINGKKKNITYSKEIIKNDNYEIFLIELFPCNSKDELHARERFFIETTDCLNKTIPTRTLQEYRQDNKTHIQDYMKIWRNENPELIKQQKQKWNEENKEKIKEQKRQWIEDNREKERERTRLYSIENKDKINARRRERYQEKN